MAYHYLLYIIVPPAGGLLLYVVVKYGIHTVLEKFFTSWRDLKDFQDDTGCSVELSDHTDRIPTDWFFKRKG